MWTVASSPEQIVGSALGRIHSPTQTEHSEKVTPATVGWTTFMRPQDQRAWREPGDQEAPVACEDWRLCWQRQPNPSCLPPSLPAGLFFRLLAGCHGGPTHRSSCRRVPGAPPSGSPESGQTQSHTNGSTVNISSSVSVGLYLNLLQQEKNQRS